MNDWMNGMNIRLLGCAAALLILAAMTVCGSSSLRPGKTAPASAISTQEAGADIASEDVFVELL